MGKSRDVSAFSHFNFFPQFHAFVGNCLSDPSPSVLTNRKFSTLQFYAVASLFREEIVAETAKRQLLGCFRV